MEQELFLVSNIWGGSGHLIFPLNNLFFFHLLLFNWSSGGKEISSIPTS